MSSIDQQFVEFVIKSLVSKPDAVKVDRRIDEKGVLLELTVDPEDLGRVIGKRGATAQSLRTLLRALGTKNDARYNLKIIDNGLPYSREPRDTDRPTTDIKDNQPDEVPETTEEAPTDDNHEEVPTDGGGIDPDDDNNTENDTEDNSDEGSDRLAQTRRELEELDDLDV
ncbi:MAG: KH domain-containing protein [Candidatus Saccharimonadales bacterium]